MLVKGGTDRGVLGLLVPGFNALDTSMARQGLGRYVGSDPRLVIMVLVTLAAIQHLEGWSTTGSRHGWGDKRRTYTENLQDIAIGLVAGEFIAGAVEAEHELLRGRRRGNVQGHNCGWRT